MNNIRGRLVSVLLGLCLFVHISSASAAETVGQGFPVRSSAAAAAPLSPAKSVQPTAVPVPVPGVSAPAVAQFETQPLAFSSGSRRQGRQNSSEGGAPGLPSLFSMLFYIGFICSLFVGALYLVKKYLPGHRQLFSHPAMEVLGRTHLDQKRYASLLRVGKRIIVVGVSQDEMRTLSEITDDEEITMIMDAARPKTEHGLTIFQKLFQRQVVETETATSQALAREQAREVEEQSAGLRARVQAIRDDQRQPAQRLDAIG